MGRGDVRDVADGGNGYLALEPGVDEVGYKLRGLFGGTMADAGEGDEFGLRQVAAEFRRGVDGDGTIAVAPEDEAGDVETPAERAAETRHVVVPGFQQAQQVEDSAGGAKVVAVGLETLGRIPTLGAGHAAKADHLKPLGKPGHAVGEELAGLGEIEADERVGFAEVGVGGGDEHERTDGSLMIGGNGQSYGSAMRVADEDWAMQVQMVQSLAYLLGCGGEAGVDVVAALGLAGAGEIERDDVLAGVELPHEGDEGVGTAHQAVEQDEGGLILHRLTLFEVGEAKAVELNLLPLLHLLRL